MAMDSGYSSGNNSRWSVSPNHLEVHHILEGNVTNNYNITHVYCKPIHNQVKLEKS